MKSRRQKSNALSEKSDFLYNTLQRYVDYVMRYMVSIRQFSKLKTVLYHAVRLIAKCRFRGTGYTKFGGHP